MPELPEVETIKNKLRVPVKIDIRLGRNSGEMGWNNKILNPKV